MEQVVFIPVDYVNCFLEHNGMVLVISRESRCISYDWLAYLHRSLCCENKIEGMIIQHLLFTIVFPICIPS